MADDGLNDQAGDGCGDPEDGDILNPRTERLKNTAHIGILEGEAKLNAEKPETHVPDLPKGKVSLFHADGSLLIYVDVGIETFQMDMQ
jgi:hypothetical protein